MSVFWFKTISQDFLEMNPRQQHQICSVRVLVNELLFPRSSFLLCHVQEYKSSLLVVILIDMFIDCQI